MPFFSTRSFMLPSKVHQWKTVLSWMTSKYANYSVFICMRSYVTSIYVHVICMSLLCHSNVFVCYSHNTNMSLAYNLHVFAYHLYVINMSTVSHSYVLVYYPHAIRMSLLYQSYTILMQLVCNHMSLTCVFYMKPSKQIKWYIRLMVVTPC